MLTVTATLTATFNINCLYQETSTVFVYAMNQKGGGISAQCDPTTNTVTVTSKVNGNWVTGNVSTATIHTYVGANVFVSGEAAALAIPFANCTSCPSTISEGLTTKVSEAIVSATSGVTITSASGHVY